MKTVLTLSVLAMALSSGAYAQTAAAPSPPAAVTAAAFLATNAQAKGVKSLPSGLQYRIVKSGPRGPSPKAGDIIKVHYEGALVSGEVFDSSIARGKPMLMPLSDLIPAWMEALPMMRVGDEWILYAPPALGYGSQGAGAIPADSVLVFRISLLGMLSAD